MVSARGTSSAVEDELPTRSSSMVADRAAATISSLKLPAAIAAAASGGDRSAKLVLLLAR